MRKRFQRGLPGVITVFCCLMFLVFFSLLLAVMELIQWQGNRMLAMSGARAAADGLAAQYDGDLLEEYEMFFLDGTFGGMGFSGSDIKSILQDYAEYQFRPNKNIVAGRYHWFFHVSVKDAGLGEMTYATDQKGAPFRQQAITYIKSQWPTDLAKGVWNQINENPVPENPEEDYEKRQESSRENIRTAEEEKEKEVVDTDTEKTVENPIEIIAQVKQRGILQLVLQHPEEVSDKKTDVGQMVSNRKVLEGKGVKNPEEVWDSKMSNLYFAQYISKKFPSYENRKKTTVDEKNRGLQYQMEYLLAGKDSDLENLKSVVYKLLLIREGVNFAYLMTDVNKQAEAESVASALAGATGTWPLIAAYRYGILLAWAYGESILDVRNLMAGGTLSPIKSPQDWQLSLANMGELLQGNLKEGKKEEQGWSYEEYLRALCCVEDQKRLTMRCLDMAEQNIRSISGRETFQADCLVYSGQVNMEVEIPVRNRQKVLTINLPFDEYAQ